MVSYTYQMPSGIPGSITRPQEALIEAQMLDQTTPPTEFGVPVKNVSGYLKPIASGDLASVIQGVLVRPYPTSGNGTDGLGVATPNKAFPGDLLKRGYINVIVNNFAVVAPVKDGAVYVRVGNAGANKVIGRFEAAAENTITPAGPTGTGNGTIGSTASTGATLGQVYTVRMTAATTFNLLDAKGAIIGSGSTGSLFTANNGLAFQVTVGGTPFVAGDFFTLTVVNNTVLVPNAYFTGGVDANGNGEIAYNI